MGAAGRTAALLLLLIAVFVAADSEAEVQRIRPFGRKWMKHFMMQKNYVNLNFGSYGSIPRAVFENQTAWREQMENCPDTWFRRTVAGDQQHVLRRMAAYLGVEDWLDLVFTDNASNSVNAVLRSFAHYMFKSAVEQGPKFTRRKIVMFNTQYGMVRNTLKHITSVWGSEIGTEQFNVTTDMLYDTDALLSGLRAFLDAMPLKGREVYFATISHITSIPAVIYDVKAITALFHEYGIIVSVDGAHCMGQIHLNLTDLDADIYLTNGHKWLFSPKGSSVLYVKKQYQMSVHPVIISSEGTGDTAFQARYEYQGTNDVSAWLSMGAALDFREKTCGGDARVIEYIHELAVDASDLLVSMWNTSRLTKDKTAFFGAMPNVALPTQNPAHMTPLLDELYTPKAGGKFTYTPFYQWEGVWYVRLSCQIFNELSDYEWLGRRVLDIIPTLPGSPNPPVSQEALLTSTDFVSLK